MAPPDPKEDPALARVDDVAGAAEAEEAEALRLALGGDGGAGGRDRDGLAELARALQAAHSPTELDPSAHAELLRSTLAAHANAPASNVVSLDARRQRTRAVAMVTVGIALAASVVLVLQSGERRHAPSGETASAVLVPPRSTESLLAATGSSRASARIDVIARARVKDGRDNYFARRGVR